MENGYFSLPLPLFLGLLTGYLFYKSDIPKKLHTTLYDPYKKYVVPEDNLDPYIQLIKKRLDRKQ